MVNICPTSKEIGDSPYHRSNAISVMKHEIVHALVRKQGCVDSLLINCFRLHVHVYVSQGIELKQDKLRIFSCCFVL